MKKMAKSEKYDMIKNGVELVTSPDFHLFTSMLCEKTEKDVKKFGLLYCEKQGISENEAAIDADPLVNDLLKFLDELMKYRQTLEIRE